MLVLGLGAWGQTRIPQLDRARGKRVTFHYTYSLSKEDAPFSPVTEGDVVVEEDAYRLNGLGLEVVCDGTTRWSMDPEAMELVIETIEKDNVVDNPGLLVSTYENFASILQVKGGSSNSLDLILDLDDDMRARFVLTDIVYMDKQGKSDFSVDEKSLSKDYVITDLR